MKDIFLGTHLSGAERAMGFRLRDTTTEDAELSFGSEGHLMTIAKTGAGKGVCSIIPTLLTTQRPVIVLDPKAENLAVTGAHRERLGHTVCTLDPFKIGPERYRVTFNPFSAMDPNGDMLVDDATMISEMLCDSATRGEDAFWVGRARQLLAGFIVHRLRKGQGPPLTCLRTMLSASQESLVALGHELLSQPSQEAKAAGGILTSEAPTTIGGILAFAQNAVGFLAGPNVHEATTRTTLDLAGLRDGKPISLYILIPPEKLISHGKLLRVWLASLMVIFMRRRTKAPAPTLILMDEAAQLGRLPQLLTVMTLMRGYGVQAWSFWQDLSQLTATYPNEWPTLLNNCGVIQLLGPLRGAASQGLAEVLPESDPTELARLAQGQSLVSLGGEPLRKVLAPNYLRDDRYQGLAKPNPFHTPPGPEV